MTDLLDVGRPDGADENPDSPWVPDDVGAADWTARKLLAAQAALTAAKEQRDREVAKWDAWLADEQTRHQRTVEWAERVLSVWLTTEIAADTSSKPRKSRKLPCGVTVKQVPGKPSLKVADRTAFVDWLKDNAPDVATSELVWKWDANKVKDRFEPRPADDLGRAELVDGNGEPVPGVYLEYSSDRVKVA